ncbi:MAG TPA: PLDc N-terminal domain-containing protein, partial [Nocardioides sp.]|nr:PLDc N-terminal domain-containing protein [Nocardioides sp.]
MDWASASAVVGVLLTVAQIAIVVIALLVLPGGRRPQTAMAWLILVVAVPFLGFALFLLLGRNTVGRKRRAQQEEVNAAILEAVPLVAIDKGTEADRDDHSALVHGLAHLNRTLGVLPFTTGNTVELLDDYSGSIEAMRQEVATATDYVHVQFYISAWDEVTAPFFEELVRATERGVTVRFLFDHLGS